MKGPPINLRAFDGKQLQNVSTIRAHFELTGIEVGTRERGFQRFKFNTQEIWQDSPVLCAGVPMTQRDVRDKRVEYIILGMDFLSRCELRIHGPNEVQLLTLLSTDGR
jgi:hypothetical protein